jgi:hypothetical protein
MHPSISLFYFLSQFSLALILLGLHLGLNAVFEKVARRWRVREGLPRPMLDGPFCSSPSHDDLTAGVSFNETIFARMEVTRAEGHESSHA